MARAQLQCSGGTNNLRGTGEQGKIGENIPVSIKALPGTLLIDQTAAATGHHQLLVGTDLYTEGDHLAPLLWHFGASHFFSSDAASVGVASVGMAQTPLLALLMETQV